MKWAAMLRGINLGKRTLRKEELIAAAGACSYAGARTLLASGNLVFDAGDATADTIERDLRDAVLRLNAIPAEVFVRDAAQLDAVIAGNPFPEVARDRPSQLLVTFHREDFPTHLLDALAERYAGPERLVAVARELFIDFPEGQGSSNLVPVLTKLKFPAGTGRNWNTVAKLAEMLA